MRNSRLLDVVIVCAFILISTTTNAVTLPLESRLGGLAFYDSNLNITWAADTSISGVNPFDYHVAWVAGLTIGGVGDWRLASADVNGDGTIVNCFHGGVSGCEDNEMGFLYWDEDIRYGHMGPFSNTPDIQITTRYYSGTEIHLSGVSSFNFIDGRQRFDSTVNDFYAWPVHDGDVGAVPVPAAAWLFSAGLLGLIGIARRKRTA